MSIETEIIDEPTHSTSSLKDLMASYNSAKEAGSQDAATITNGIKIASVDEIKDIAKEYTLKIQELLDSDAEQSTLSKTAEKGLALIDTKSNFLQRWFGSKKTAVKAKDIEQQSIDGLVQSLKSAIESKREAAIETTEKLINIKDSMIERLALFEHIEAEVTKLIDTASSVREQFDAKRLAISVKGTIENIKNDITTVYEPLVMMATVAVENIQNNLPTVEDDLQRMLAAKAGQKNIQQLNDIYLAYSEMGKQSRQKVKAAVNKTMLDTINLVGNTGIDVKEIEASAKADIEHTKKIHAAMNQTVEKIKVEYNEINRIQASLIENRKTLDTTMIAQYSTTGIRS